MTADATAKLIQRIMKNLSPTGASAQNTNTSFLGQTNSLLGDMANYAQILGTAAGPLAQAAAASELGKIAAEQIDSTLTAGAKAEAEAAAQNAGTVTASQAAATAAEAGALAGAAAGTFVGAIVLFISLFLSAVATSDQSGSAQAQEMAQLNNTVQDIQNETLSDYWQGKWSSIAGFWNSPTGGLQTDLDNIANEGTGGKDVKHDVGLFHDNAMAFVNNLVPSKTPWAQEYWERPFVKGLLFATQGVPYPALPDPSTPGAPVAWGAVLGWYGKNWPEAQTGPALGGATMVLDPCSTLPCLLLGLQSYLTIETLLNVIDLKQTTFSEFLKQFNGDIKEYADFLYSQYQLAVNGILKSDIPSPADVRSYLYFIDVVGHTAVFANTTVYWGGTYPYPAQPGVGWPYAGYCWNGVYGAVDEYPPYGAYQPIPFVPPPYSSPGYLLDLINTDKLQPEYEAAIGPSSAFSQEGLLQAANQEAWLTEWILPWVECKLMLGIMARWKAIYLVKAYDKVWSILQHLRSISNQAPLPTMMLAQDGTIADGNWSARELCRVLNQNWWSASTVAGYVLFDATSGYRVDTTHGGRFSLRWLVKLLDGIGSGNWGGYTPPVKAPTNLSFRDLLAAAAV